MHREHIFKITGKNYINLKVVKIPIRTRQMSEIAVRPFAVDTFTDSPNTKLKQGKRLALSLCD